MRYAVLSQHGEVFGLKKMFVADLHRVLPAARKIAEKIVERPHEVPPMLEIGLVELRELENERADFFPKWLACTQKRIPEQK